MKEPTFGVGPEYQIPDALWAEIAKLIPPPKPKKKDGRPRMPDRQAMTAILYLARTGCQWKALPRSLGAPSTVHDRLKEWCHSGVFAAMWRAAVLYYDDLKGLNWEWQAMDGAMTKAPLGGGIDRLEPHRSLQARHQAQLVDRSEWHSGRTGSGGCQPPRYEVG